ncbi:MAG TPA: Gfo/Idh/MocA family oxidoreductase, partial [Bacillota bacterium]|nr:Gfo/Idh/MocA family oxidoreductase [Bacillota bacterium]
MPALVSGRKVRVAFIGAGGNARGHMRAVHRNPEAEVVAICDSSEQALADAATRIPELAELPKFTDYREMIERIHPDGAIISIPHTLHYEVAAHALERGVSVEVEKPMTCDPGDARRLMALRDRTGLVLAVGYQRHYQGVWRWVHEHVAGGQYGPVHFVEAWQCQSWGGGGWRGVPALSGGGQLNDSGSHLCDIMLWASGIRPAEVFGFQENRGLAVDRISAISFRFPEAGLGTMSIIGESVRGMDEGMQFWCREGRVRVDGIDNSVRVTLYGPDGAAHPVDTSEIPNYPVDKDGNFVRCILGQDEPQVPAE